MDSVQAETNDKEVKKVFSDAYIQVLSQLYTKLCNCRQLYEELDAIADPKFHLDDCEYRIALERIHFQYD